MERRKYTEYYFKDRPAGEQLMSGLPLPKDSDGIVRGKDFVRCSFHPNCCHTVFEYCTFDDCDGDWYIEHERNMKDCVVTPKRGG